MEKKIKLSEIRSMVGATVDAPDFLKKTFSFVAKKRKENFKLEADNLKRVCFEEYDGISNRIDASFLQDSCSVRNNLRTRRLANLLIDDHGILQRSFLKKLIEQIKKNLYFLGPKREHDSKRQEHILFILEMLDSRKDLIIALQSITKPHFHPIADQVIRNTLQLSEHAPITNAAARRAALSALLCYLRQTVGSCFATAPAIIIHDEQPRQFLTDLNELFSSGKLKRTFGGQEYSVPFALSTGVSDLKRPFWITFDELEKESKMSFQPGLLSSFEHAELIDPSISTKEKAALLHQLLKKSLKEKQQAGPYILLTAEEIIKKVLLDHFSITEQDVIDYENHFQKTPQSYLTQKVSKDSSSLSFRITQYQQLFEKAKIAFKAFSDNQLLRAWEYTLASFAETKGEFSKWNLYSSLGLRHDEPGGIGSFLYVVIKSKLDRLNLEVQDYQFQYEQMFQQVKLIENRLKRAATEDEARWLKIDYQVKVSELDTLLQMRNQLHFQAERMSKLFDDLVDFYINLFPEYFQEVYDPELIDVDVGLYDDSPAGFRLLFKHGRSNTSQWTVIKTAQEYTDALNDFFISAERVLETEESFQGIETILSEITTEIVSHIRTNEFLETALYRMAQAHRAKLIKDPLKNLDKVEKKPWVYTSGGNLETLVSVYFKREYKPEKVSCWVENPMELLVFFADTLKQIPYSITDAFKKDRKKSMIMFSPTHAFLLKPGKSPFIDAWSSKDYTYTWVRDHLIFPRERFNEELTLTPDAMRYIIKHLLNQLPVSYRHSFNQAFGSLQGSMSPQIFRDYLVYGMETTLSLQYKGRPILDAAEIDSVLFSLLPIFPFYELKDRVVKILGHLPKITKKGIEDIKDLLDALTPRYSSENVIGAFQLQEICKGLICLYFNQTSFSFDYHRLIKDACEKEGFCMPAPIVFADTNWPRDDFAFVVNPGTGRLELWRVDPIGQKGAPMASWSHWIDGSQSQKKWGVFTRPYEYILG